ncbi:hypothetical protein ACHAWF_002272 [Thalassiosira exigua]
MLNRLPSTVSPRQGEGDDAPPSHQLVVAPPPHQPTTLGQLLLLYVLVPIFFPLLFAYKYLSEGPFRSTLPSTIRNLYGVISRSTLRPISRQRYYQENALLKQLWELPSARAYRENGVEYQVKEGFCGSATLRCVLSSFGLSLDELPAQVQGATDPEKWCANICRQAEEYQNRPGCDDSSKFELETRIVKGDIGYDEFVSTLKEALVNENVRIACNFLRSALMGFERVRYVPTNFIFAMFVGHFSPILGILDGKDAAREDETKDGDAGDNNNPLVAIFDTNAKYGGVYFVPARRLHDAVRTVAVDISSNERRAIVLVEKKKAQT